MHACMLALALSRSIRLRTTRLCLERVAAHWEGLLLLHGLLQLLAGLHMRKAGDTGKSVSKKGLTGLRMATHHDAPHVTYTALPDARGRATDPDRQGPDPDRRRYHTPTRNMGLKAHDGLNPPPRQQLRAPSAAPARQPPLPRTITAATAVVRLFWTGPPGP